MHTQASPLARCNQAAPTTRGTTTARKHFPEAKMWVPRPCRELGARHAADRFFEAAFVARVAWVEVPKSDRAPTIIRVECMHGAEDHARMDVKLWRKAIDRWAGRLRTGNTYTWAGAGVRAASGRAASRAW